MTYSPTVDTVIAYTEGDCWHLAHTLHQMTGWPMVFFVAHPYPEDDPLDCWDHVAIQMPDGHILDVNGPQTCTAFVRAWRYGTHTPYALALTSDPEDIERALTDQERIYAEHNTHEVAQALLAEIGALV